jgi:hypothetical protein
MNNTLAKGDVPYLWQSPFLELYLYYPDSHTLPSLASSRHRYIIIATDGGP